MTKTKKLIIAASSIWGLISIIISGAITEESYAEFNVWAFLGLLLFFTCPIWLYGAIYWIFGEGFLLKNIKKLKVLIINWPLTLSIGWFTLCVIAATGEMIDGISSFWEVLMIPSIAGAPSWIYWFYLYKTHEKRQTPEHKMRSEELKTLHPWKRFWARWLDWFVCGLCIFTPLFWAIGHLAFSGAEDLLGISEQFEKMEIWYDLTDNPALIALAVVLIWIPIESLLLSLIGTTPGKSLFGIKVRKENGDKLNIKESFKRSLHVAGSGAAYGIPLLNIAFLYSSYQRLKNQKNTVWDEKGNYVVNFDNLHILRQGLAYFCIVTALFISAYLQAIPADDYSKYEQDTITFGVIQKNMEERADALWGNFNADLRQVRIPSQNLENIENLTEYSLNSYMEDKQAFAKKLINYKLSLTGNLDTAKQEIISSDIQPNYKKSLLKNFSPSAEEAKQLINSYISAVQKENESYLSALKFIAQNANDIQIENGRLLFSTPQKFEKYSELIKIAKSTKDTSYEAQIKLTKFATGEDLKKSDLEKADISDAYFEIRAAFENSPAYQLLNMLYENDKKELEQLYRKYAEIYVKSGLDQAEQEIMKAMSSLAETKLDESLPKASSTALYNFTQSILNLTEQMLQKRPDLCPSFFSGKIDGKEFSAFFTNELDNDPREKYLLSITEIVLSAKNNPGSYNLSPEEIEQKLETPYLKAFAAVGDKASYLIDGSAPKSPGDVCMTIRAIYGEVLQLPSPDREDALRYMYASE